MALIKKVDFDYYFIGINLVISNFQTVHGNALDNLKQRLVTQWKNEILNGTLLHYNERIDLAIEKKEIKLIAKFMKKHKKSRSIDLVEILKQR
ncbi:hypothetical protein [Rufibacter ruber]|uniref:hypothetical protein n=1 Tax=Rufibacter ruber TaxID=1783499 RepID=UPI000836A008|nr:hypothetical protein [Rufibacter ruber]